MQTVTKDELATLAAKGPILLGDYRSGGQELEQIKWRDNKTGQAMTAEVRNFNFELGESLLRVQHPRDAKATDTLGITPGDLKRGTIYLIRAQSAQMNRGVLSVTGTIHPFSSEGPAKR